MIADNQETLLTAVFYTVWQHKPVDVADLATRLLAYEGDINPRDPHKLVFSRLAAQALLRELPRQKEPTPSNPEAVKALIAAAEERNPPPDPKLTPWDALRELTLQASHYVTDALSKQSWEKVADTFAVLHYALGIMRR